MKPGERLVSVRTVDHQTGPLVEAQRAVARRCRRRSSRRCATSQVVHAARDGLARAPRKGRAFRAVDDVSFDDRRGECFGLVGESGCGKTTLSKIIMRALEPDSRRASLYNDRGTQLDVAHARRRRADALPPARPVSSSRIRSARSTRA